MGSKPAVVFFVFLLISSFLASNIYPANAGTIIVPNDYYSIQAAINAASTGDTIFVRSGTYYEHVVVNKTVSLIGENQTSTIIDGSGTGTIITILVSNVKISRFTIQNSNVSSKLDGGIVLSLISPRFGANNKANITQNTFVRTLYGIRIDGSSQDNYISRNSFRNVTHAITAVSGGNRILKNSILYSGEGISLHPPNTYLVNNSVLDNYFAFVQGASLTLLGGKNVQFFVRNNTILNSSMGLLVLGGMNSVFENNTMARNFVGISLGSYGFNRFFNNRIFSNVAGIVLSRIPGPGPSNIFRNNTMFNNTQINFGFRNFFPASLSDYVQDADTSNTINGKPLLYLVNKRDLAITDTDQYAFIAIVNSTKIIVRNVNITGNIASDVEDRYGSFIFAYTTNSSIGKLITKRSFIIASNNTMLENNEGPMDFQRSYNNTLRNNDGTSLSFLFSNGNRFFNNTSSTINLTASNGSLIEGNSGIRVSLLFTGLSPQILWSSTNSLITNNSLSGLSIYHSYSNTVSNNTFTGPYSEDIKWDDSHGIFLNGDNNTIMYNEIRGFAQGISSDFRLVKDNTIAENIIANNTVGINVRGQRNVFMGNTLIKNRFNIYGEGLIGNEFDSSNTIDGKPAYLIFNESNTIVDPSTYPSIGYLGIVNSENVTISDLTLTNNVEGVLIYNSRNVTVINSTIKENVIGLKITGTSNNIINNTVTNNLHGISVVGQGHDLIFGNTIANNTYFNLDPDNQDFKNGWGPPYYLSLLISYGIGSDLIEGGVFIGSGNNTISSNKITTNIRGISLVGGNNTFRDNQLAGNTLNIKMDYLLDINQLTQDMDSSNTVDAKPIYYWINQSDKQVPEDAGFVALINSTNITMKNLNITRNQVGIYLAGVQNTTITNTTITGCVTGIYIGSLLARYSHEPLRLSRYDLITNSVIRKTGTGITVWPANNTIISNNILSENMISVWLGYGSLNVIEDNTITNNTDPSLMGPWPFPAREIPYPWVWNEGGAIVIDSSNNTLKRNTIAYNDVGLTVGSPVVGAPGGNLIYHNNFINNTEQVRVGSLNFWDNGYPEGGNYFSDYAGKDQYKGAYQNETGSDGIGDTPYDLMQSSNWMRRFVAPTTLEAVRWAKYPLMKPYPWASHDLGITQTSTPKTIVTNDTSLPITVGIFNYGAFSENLTLIIQANSTILASYPNITLTSHNSATFTFLWNTTGWTMSNYTLTVQVTPALGETDTADNIRHINVIVTILGDCNGDFTVNLDDANLIKQVWQSSRNQPNYNPNNDLNNDGIINIQDAAIIGLNWQKHT